MTPSLGFKVTALFKGEYFKTVHFYIANCR